MEITRLGPTPPPSERTSAHPHKEMAHSVQTSYDTSIGRYVSQVVADGEVVRQVPSPRAVSFARSFTDMVLRLFGKRI